MSEGTKSAVEELAELEAQEAAEAKAADVSGAREAAARLELENRKAIRDIKAKNPGVEIWRVDTIAGMCLVKAPNEEQFKRFHKMCLDAETKPEANRTLAYAGTIYPHPDTLEEWGKMRPAIFNSLANRIIEVAGADTTAKKV